MIYPSIKEYKALSEKYCRVPLIIELGNCSGSLWDYYDPDLREGFLFECKDFSYMSLSVEGRYKAYAGNVKSTINDLKKLMKINLSPRVKGFSFTGGLAGYFSYDFIREFEKLKKAPCEDICLPEINLLLCNEMLILNKRSHKLYLARSIKPNGGAEEQYQKTVSDMILKGKALNKTNKRREKERERISIKGNITKEEYEAMAEKGKEHITKGEVCQVVLSKRLTAEGNVDGAALYDSLRKINPSPYMFYIKLEECTLVGSSPEMLAKVAGFKVSTCPIAGTRKRGDGLKEDKKLEKELIGDAKEISEHIMLLDLGINDIGKVSEAGTVRVKELMKVRRFSHVMHLVSLVEGELRKDKDVFDVLLSVSPAGTLSGAPKLRAMEIIDELEKSKRGIYGGTVGYISFGGDMESCIAIRTSYIKGKKAYIQTGAGIVSDSVPEREYEEAVKKSEALLEAFEEVYDIDYVV